MKTKLLFMVTIVLTTFCSSVFAQIIYNEALDKGQSEPEDVVRVVSVPVPATLAAKGTPQSRPFRFIVLARSRTQRNDAFPIIEDKRFEKVQSIPAKQTITPNRWFIYYLTGNINNPVSQTDPDSNIIPVRMSWQKQENAIRTDSKVILDLVSLSWKSLYRGEKSLPSAETLPADYFGNSPTWNHCTIPNIWNDLGVTWLKTEIKITIPEYARHQDYVLLLPAIDDNDVTWFNRKKIGATKDWDRLRRYLIPADLIRSGENNELLIAVENTNAGGGIQSSSYWIGPKSEEPKFSSQTNSIFPEDVIQHESKRRPNRPQGKPLPLRSMQVKDGILEYSDGGEVALWGTNYYPQSWNQYLSLKERKIDHYKAVDVDLEDIAPAALAQPGQSGLDPRRMNMIRIHVFDTEISDRHGNLVKNDHLDILDYLTAQCYKHGLYLWLTPIAWWGSPCQNQGAFSSGVPIQAMTLLPENWDVQKNWIRQFLTHKNPYTNRRLLDEPCLALFEIMNETLYWSYSTMIKNPDTFQEKDRWMIPWIQKTIVQWEKSLPDPSWKSAFTWDFYCYETVQKYINEMTAVYREIGVRQPIAYHAGSWSTHTPVYWAIADSDCDAVTRCYYSGLSQTPIADKRSNLKDTVRKGLPRQFDKKARLVYEFDASDTLFQIDLYPAIARLWRELGVQAACQFQYDSRFTADRNVDWPTHYLNVIHAPNRFASFMLAGETFRNLSRGIKTELANDQLIFPPTATSWKENAAYLATDSLFMQAQESSWRPFPFPKEPRRILGTGSTPYYRYDGSGFVDLKLDGHRGTLSLGPNVIRHRNDLRGTAEQPLTTLSQEKKKFELLLPEWKDAEFTTDSGESVNPQAGLVPGKYVIQKK